MKELSAELRKAQEYENKALKEENENKFPVFHLKVPTGWMNDPNGFLFIRESIICSFSIILIPGTGDPCTGGM